MKLITEIANLIYNSIHSYKMHFLKIYTNSLLLYQTFWYYSLYTFLISYFYYFCTPGDLWGPLLVCLLLSSVLSFTAPGDTASLVFAAVFVIVWCGAAAVTINAQLLGGSISFFQSICILGYCVFPLTIASIICLVLSFVYKQVRKNVEYE